MTRFIVPPAPSPHSTNTCHSLSQRTRSTGDTLQSPSCRRLSMQCPCLCLRPSRLSLVIVSGQRPRPLFPPSPPKHFFLTTRGHISSTHPFSGKVRNFLLQFPFKLAFPLQLNGLLMDGPGGSCSPGLEQGAGGTWRGPPGLTLRPSMLQQLFLSKLHPMTLDLWGDAHGETRVPILSPSQEKTLSSPLQEKRRKRPNHPSAPA